MNNCMSLNKNMCCIVAYNSALRKIYNSGHTLKLPTTGASVSLAIDFLLCVSKCSSHKRGINMHENW